MVYDDPNESDKKKGSYKFYFLDQDFEFSFGSCLSKSDVIMHECLSQNFCVLILVDFQMNISISLVTNLQNRVIQLYSIEIGR